jgi:uncharacterized MAPEG superfamily protein
MTIALWCVLAAGLLPYISTMIAKSKGPYDNNAPRDWLQNQTGFRQRANAAQQNSFEAFPLFAAAVSVAQLLNAPHATIDRLAAAFIAVRLLYVICYVADWATLRTLVWFAGMVCVVSIFVVAAR